MKIEKILILSLMVLLVLAACKKDKNETSYDNYVKYDGVMYPIDFGVIENYGHYYVDNSYSLDLWFLSKGLEIVEINDEWDHETGVGHIIFFRLNTDSASLISSGTYNYTNSTYDAGTFIYSDMTLNYDANHNTWDLYKVITDGTITVSRTADIYEFNINCTTSDDKSFTGYFKGPLIYYDYDSKKSTKKPVRKTY